MRKRHILRVNACRSPTCSATGGLLRVNECRRDGLLQSIYQWRQVINAVRAIDDLIVHVEGDNPRLDGAAANPRCR